MKKIAVLTTSRADYGTLYSILKKNAIKTLL